MNLVKLRLTYQSEFKAAVKALSTARKRLAIEIVNTHERHGQVNTWLGGTEMKRQFVMEWIFGAKMMRSGF